MGVDSCNVFGERPLLVIFTIVWFIAASCMVCFFLSLLQTESCLKAHIFFILKPFFGGPQALILPLVGRFNKLCKIGHRSEKQNKTTKTHNSLGRNNVPGSPYVAYLICSNSSPAAIA